MLINFLHPALLPSVECCSIATEGYEIQNLVSADTILSERGFLAERFISGPVSIIIKLIGPINIKHIIIWSKVSNQKSLGFELSSMKYSEDETDFRRFASAIIRNDSDGITFYQEGITFDAQSSDISSFFKSTFFRGKGHENVIQLKIKVFKFHYIAALKKIEIWGEPGRLCTHRLKKKIIDSWIQIQKQFSCPPVFLDSTKEAILTNKQNDFLSTSTSDPVPNEFYDEITHEIMTLPMVLPSGKVVDYQTLEKHAKAEAKWGRAPSDPFTGVKFSDNNKPMVATVLKSRIDIFLLTNSDKDCIKTLPRRLGGENSLVSKLVDKNERKRNYEEDELSDIYSNYKSRKVSNLDGNNIEENSKLSWRSYLKPPKPVKQNNACIECTTADNLYKCPCMHTICRVCIIKNENKCKTCQISFSYAEIQKIHVSNVF